LRLCGRQILLRFLAPSTLRPTVRPTCSCARCSEIPDDTLTYRSAAPYVPLDDSVIRRAKMRSTFHDFAWDLDRWLVRIVALVSFSASRVEARAARLRYLLVLLVPIRGPLPHVAGHVVEPVTVGRKTSHRRCSLEPVFFKILPGEFALPGVGHVLAIRCK